MMCGVFGCGADEVSGLPWRIVFASKYRCTKSLCSSSDIRLTAHPLPTTNSEPQCSHPLTIRSGSTAHCSNNSHPNSTSSKTENSNAVSASAKRSSNVSAARRAVDAESRSPIGTCKRRTGRRLGLLNSRSPHSNKSNSKRLLRLGVRQLLLRRSRLRTLPRRRTGRLCRCPCKSALRLLCSNSNNCSSSSCNSNSCNCSCSSNNCNSSNKQLRTSN